MFARPAKESLSVLRSTRTDLVLYGVVLLLVLEESLLFLVPQMTREYEGSSVGHLLHLFSAILTTTVLPGLPYAELLLRRMHAPSFAKLVGLASILSFLWYLVYYRVLAWLNLLHSPRTFFATVVLCSMFGLLLVVVAKNPVSWRLDRTWHFIVLVVLGLGSSAVIVGFRGGYLTYPTYRCLDVTEENQLKSPRTIRAALRPGRGIIPLGATRWQQVSPQGRLQIARSGPAGTYPLRLAVFGPVGTPIYLCPHGIACREYRIRNEPDFKGLPVFQVGVIAFDIPSSASTINVNIPSLRDKGAPFTFRDYSNLSNSALQERLEADGFRVSEMLLISEIHRHINANQANRDVLFDNVDMITGYQHYRVVAHLCGPSFLGTHLTYLAALVLCLFFTSELLHLAYARAGFLVLIFPGLTHLMLQSLSVGSARTYLPDAHFSAFLMLSLLLCNENHGKAFLLSTLPAMLCRATGAYLEVLTLLSSLIQRSPRKQVLRTLVWFIVLWSGLVMLFSLEKIVQGEVIKAAAGILAVMVRENVPTSSGQAWRAIASFGRRIVHVSGGLCLFLLLPRNRLGWQVLFIVSGYGFMLMWSRYQQIYRLLPLVAFCGLGAGANILPFRPRYVLVLSGIALAMLLWGIIRFS